MFSADHTSHTSRHVTGHSPAVRMTASRVYSITYVDQRLLYRISSRSERPPQPLLHHQGMAATQRECLAQRGQITDYYLFEIATTCVSC